MTDIAIVGAKRTPIGSFQGQFNPVNANELGAAARALQSLAETLETQPESLLKGKSPLGN